MYKGCYTLVSFLGQPPLLALVTHANSLVIYCSHVRSCVQLMLIKKFPSTTLINTVQFYLYCLAILLFLPFFYFHVSHSIHLFLLDFLSTFAFLMALLFSLNCALPKENITFYVGFRGSRYGEMWDFGSVKGCEGLKQLWMMVMELHDKSKIFCFCLFLILILF